MPAPRKTPLFRVLTLNIAIIWISGCGGDFSYKRGANMTDFQSEKENCSEQNATESAIDQCLEQSGWVVVAFDKPLVEPQPEPATTSDDSTGSVDQPTVIKTTNPLDKVHISSWWKVGAGPGKLLADGDSCASELGAAYKPERNMSLVTYGFIQCMKDRGWFALQEK